MKGWWRPDPFVECSIGWNKAVSQFLDGEGEPGQITPTEESEKGTAEVERWGDENCNRCSSLFSSGSCFFPAARRLQRWTVVCWGQAEPSAVVVTSLTVWIEGIFCLHLSEFSFQSWSVLRVRYTGSYWGSVSSMYKILGQPAVSVEKDRPGRKYNPFLVL